MALSKKTPPKTTTLEAPVIVEPQKPSALVALEKKLMSKKVRDGMKALEKKFGPAKIFGMHKPMRKLEVVPTGFYDLDHYVIGRGGFPKGRTVEISGPESSGKTTVLLYSIANFQKHGLVCGFVDAEIAMDVEYAQACGVRTDLWLYGIPITAEETVEMTLAFLTGKYGIECDAVFVDSTGAFRPKKDIEKKVGKARVVGARANLQDELISKSKECVVTKDKILGLISQMRANVGATMFEKKTKTTTSKALDHEFSLRIEVKGGQKITRDERVIGRKIKFKTTKNKIGTPFQECEIDMMYGVGLSPECMLLDAAVRARIIEKNGSWFAYEGERIGQGREAAKNFLIQNPDLVMKLIARLDHIRETGEVVAPSEQSAAFDIDDVDYGDFDA